MKKTLISLAVAALSLSAFSCSNASNGASSEDKAFLDSLAFFMGRANGGMLAQNMPSQLPPQELANFNKESFLRGFKTALMSDTGDVAYKYGLNIGLNFSRNLEMLMRDSVNIDVQRMYKAFAEAFTADTVNTFALQQEMGIFEKLMQKVQDQIQQRQMLSTQARNAEAAAQAAENEAKGAEFIAEAKKADPSIVTTESGLSYKVNVEGTGVKPTDKDKVKVHYVGKLIDGTTFDSSVDRGEPADFAVTQVVPGFAEGLKLMSKGAKYTLYIPANLAYGNNATGSIPPGSTLIFDVEMLEVNP